MRLLSTLFLLALAHAAKFTQHATGHFAFVGSFCFDHNTKGGDVGTVDFHIDFPAGFDHGTSTWVAIYDDQSNSWPSVHGHSLTCEETLLPKYSPNGRSGELGPSLIITQPDEPYIHTLHISEVSRPRFWWFAVVNCNTSLSGVTVETHFKNTIYSTWDHEFGANEVGVNSLFLTYFLFSLFFMPACVWSSMQLKKKVGFAHPLVKAFVASVILFAIGCFFCFIAMAKFSNDGIGSPGLYVAGGFSLLESRVLFMLLLLLLARGWTISKNEHTGFKYDIALIAVFNILCIASLFYSADS